MHCLFFYPQRLINGHKSQVLFFTLSKVIFFSYNAEKSLDPNTFWLDVKNGNVLNK